MIAGVPELDPTAISRGGRQTTGRAGRAAALGLLCFFVFNANLRFIGSFDSLASSLLPFNLLHGNGLTLDAYGNYPPGLNYSILPGRDGRLASMYPVVTPLLVTPLYLPVAYTALGRAPISDEREYFRQFMEKLSASLLVSLSVVFLYLTLARFLPDRMALLLAAIYAFATPTWTISSQALWQHGTAQLLLSIALFLLYARPPTSSRIALLGLVVGLIVANRPADLVFAPVIGLIALRRWKLRSWMFFAAAGAVGVLLLAYNLSFFGTPGGGYSRFRADDGTFVRVSENPLPGMVHLLFSNRGLLFFCPFFLLFLRRPRWRDIAAAPTERLLFLLAVIANWALLASLSTGWWGGYTYGPRYAIDGLPVLFFLLAPHLQPPLRLGWRALLAITAGVALAIQVVGAFCYPGGDSGTARYGFWTFAKSPPVLAAKAGLQAPHFLGYFHPDVTMRAPLPPAEMRAYLAWDVPSETFLTAGARRPVRVNVRNQSGVPWSSLGYRGETNGIRLVTRWETLDGEIAPDTREAFHWIGLRLRPGETARLRLLVAAPPVSGNYRFVLDVAQLGAGSFSARGGSAALEALVAVAPP